MKKQTRELVKKLSNEDIVALIQNNSQLSHDMTEEDGTILPTNADSQKELKEITQILVDEMTSRVT